MVEDMESQNSDDTDEPMDTTEEEGPTISASSL